MMTVTVLQTIELFYDTASGINNVNVLFFVKAVFILREKSFSKNSFVKYVI